RLRTADSLPASATTAVAVPPASCIARAVSRADSTTSQTTTRAPAAANTREVAWPIPEAAPVTIATLPASGPVISNPPPGTGVCVVRRQSQQVFAMVCAQTPTSQLVRLKLTFRLILRETGVNDYLPDRK